jgi:diphthamide biosynthesis enzyme Dph1/Dph2-like protein
MKVLFVESKKKFNSSDYIKKAEELAGIIKRNYNLFYSVQYKELADWLVNFLSKKGKKLLVFKQVLGCSNFKLNNNAIIMFVGSGRFHALQVAINNNKEVITFPLLEKISEKEISEINKIKKTAASKFLMSNNIGILVSTKPGQEELEKALFIKDKLEESGKKAFIFLSDLINIGEAENFNIDFWVNTACPRIPSLPYQSSAKHNTISIEDTLQYINKK